MGLNATLASASQSLQVFSTGVQVAGQNISNANTPGYIREELLLETSTPFTQGNLVLGSGVQHGGIKQQINLFLESRIHAANSEAELAQARETIYQQLETQIQELGESDLSTSLDNFLASINDVVNQPESSSIRVLAVQEGQQFANNVRSLRDRVNRLRDNQSDKVNSLVDEANSLLDSIEQLNPQISRLEAGGLNNSEAGALRSQRYQALNRLSEIVPITFRENVDGEVDVFTGSDYLILSGTSQRLQTIVSADRETTINTVQLSRTGSDISLNGGELRGVIEGRDSILGGFIDQLNIFTSNIISEFNRLHTSGEGLKGFDSITSQSQVDSTSAALNVAGLDFTPTHGSFQLKVVNKITGITETTNIDIDLDGIGGNDTTLASLQAAIAGVSNIGSATITTDRRLQITADANYEFRFGDDTSGVLNALGINTFFTGVDSNDIGVNSVVINDHAFFASGKGGGPSDGSNAVGMAEFIDKPIEAIGNINLDDYYNTTISSIAQSSASESIVAQGFVGFQESLINQRNQYSGVSLDEEAIQILGFQRAFQSAARIISTIDELFTTLLTM